MELTLELELNGCVLQGLEAAARRSGSLYCVFVLRLPIEQVTPHFH